jgi:hypothetical protein
MQSIWYDCNGCVFINMKFCFNEALANLTGHSVRVAGTGGRLVLVLSPSRRFLVPPFVASHQRLNVANDFTFQDAKPSSRLGTL